MKIVVFGNCSGFGGAQTAFRRLVEFLVEDRHLVGVIGLSDREDNLPMSERTAFGVRVAPGKTSPLRKLTQVLRATAATRRHGPEIFVAVGLAHSAAFIARRLPRKTFRICQDFIFGRQTSDPLLLSANRAFDALAVQSPSMVEALRSQHYGALPLAHLPCFPNPVSPGCLRTKQRDNSRIRMAYFGRLAPNKGLDMLLPALARARLPIKVLLDIWGKGNEEAALRKLVSEFRLDSVVQFRGTYPEPASHLISEYDGLLLPSTGLEGLPLILLEAMACGVPVLATRVGAIPDCCAENEDAILVEPNAEAIRVGLETFAGRTLNDGFSSKRLMHYFESRFSFDAMASRWRAMLADPRSFFPTYART